MNKLRKFMQDFNEIFDEEKRLEKSKNILKFKIDRLKRIDKSKKELENLRKELENLENSRFDSKI